jgi:hypothetical protein
MHNEIIHYYLFVAVARNAEVISSYILEYISKD